MSVCAGPCRLYQFLRFYTNVNKRSAPHYTGPYRATSGHTGLHWLTLDDTSLYRITLTPHWFYTGTTPAVDMLLAQVHFLPLEAIDEARLNRAASVTALYQLVAALLQHQLANKKSEITKLLEAAYFDGRQVE